MFLSITKGQTMSNDRFRGTGEFHPNKAWSEIQRKDWERKNPADLGAKGWVLVAGVLLAAVLAIGSAAFFVWHYFL